uniref:Ubiquitin-conjugating enzyme E2, J2 (UBC6 homolog, yeast) n=1 Tax=Hucho hucho TaxID=62062 RepID=A0A4W5KQ77_9TELE
MNNHGNKRAPTTATQRLKQDYLRIKKDPVPYIYVNVIQIVGSLVIYCFVYFLQKRQLSAQSLAFNLKEKVFCELFPDAVDEIKQKQKAQEELSARPLPLPDVVPDGDPHHGNYGIPALNGGHAPLGPANLAPGLQQANRNHGLLGGALANLFVIVGFAAFAYTVKYVLRSIAQE